MRRTKWFVLLVFLLGFGLSLHQGRLTNAQTAPIYTIMDLGVSSDGYVRWEVKALSNSGLVAGNASTSSLPNSGRGFLTNGIVSTDLIVPGMDRSDVRTVNDAGMATGRYFTPDSKVLSYLYDGTAARDIGNLGAGNNTQAMDMNSFGHVVGFSSRADFKSGAFVYDGAQMIDLGQQLAGFGAIESWSVGINDSGAITGWFFLSGFPTRRHTFLYKDGTMHDLGSLDGLDATPFKINSHGHVVGLYTGLSQPPFTRAFIYDGVMKDISTPAVSGQPYWNSKFDGIDINEQSHVLVNEEQLSPFALRAYVYDGVARNYLSVPGFSLASDLNNMDQVVGFTSLNGANEPWLYSDGSLYLLQQLIPSHSGWDLEVAAKINDSGQIAGFGFFNGERRGFLMTPVPESNTPPGTNVETTPVDTSGGGTPVTISFGEVVTGGETTLQISTTGPQPPAGFKIGNPPVYYYLETTAVFNGSATLCINYSGISYANANNLKLMHQEGNTWVDRTSSHDPASQTICATVTSFSPFAVFELDYDFAGFFSPVENGTVVNSMKAGAAVPLKFSLGGDMGLDIMADGYPKSSPITCDLGSVNEFLEETLTAGASGLTYDSATGQYVYVWKSQKAWAGTCRQFVLKLKDGSAQSAKFRFAK